MLRVNPWARSTGRLDCPGLVMQQKKLREECEGAVRSHSGKQ
jgi:hypothetical protein